MNGALIRMADHIPSHLQPASPWVARFAGLIPGDGPREGMVLDLAAGHGRHARLLLGLGHKVLAVDRAVEPLAPLAADTSLEILQADLETGTWPLAGRRFAGIVVTDYLHRPLFPHLLDALSPGGALIYETYALGQEKFGRPSRPEFLLRPGELLELTGGRFHVVAYEDLVIQAPHTARVQRIAAVKD